MKAEWLHYPTPTLWAPQGDGCITPSPKVKAEWLHYPTQTFWAPGGWLHYPIPQGEG